MAYKIQLTLLLLLIALSYPESAEPVSEIHNPVESHQIVDAAFARLTLAGLEVPHIEFHFSSDLDSCGGHRGLHSGTRGAHRIDLCRSGPIEKLILHEIGHAWAGDNLTPSDRSAFLAMRGLRVWNDHDAEWKDRGTEHAAQILAWGLSERCRAPQWIGQHQPDELHEAFVFLTGTHPICELIPAGQSTEQNPVRLGRVQP